MVTASKFNALFFASFVTLHDSVLKAILLILGYGTVGGLGTSGLFPVNGMFMICPKI